MLTSYTEVARRALYRVAASDRAFEKAIGWRRAKLKRDWLREHGPVVGGGPFVGMKLDPVAELPKYLGSYEHSLRDTVERLVAEPYETILNIGCAEGYYAVGLALRMPEVRVLACDLDERQRELCTRNAALNGVSDRIRVSGRFAGDRFAEFAGTRTLVLCDIEGGEVELLRPDLHPALADLDLLIELHEDKHPAMRREMETRFGATHSTEAIERRSPDTPAYEARYPAEMDQLAATYENRFGPTSWLLCLSRAMRRSG